MPRKKLPERKNSVIKVGIYDTKHKQQLQQRAKQVQQLYRKAIDKITKAAQPSLFGGDPAREFHFSDFPALNKEVDKFIQEMGAGLQSNMEQGDKDAWTLSNTKNDAMVDYMAGAYSGDLPKETLQQWKHPHLEALDAFMKRREAGMNLSNGGNAANKLIKGVWNLEQFKGELELALEMGIGQGKSAAELSKDVRQFLKYPDKLFRRVRDKDGVLRLSKAAKAFHPGRGVYRSSYKNALRLTATENNIAYRTCDNERWNDLPFVLGQEIRTSNNHTSGGHDLVDICDELAGRYPVEFKFTGWHPWCRCYAVSILADEKEMDEYCRKIANGEDVSGFQFTGKQTEMPDEWNEWMKANKDRIEEAQAKGRQMPYFIKDNFKDGDPTKELRWIGDKKPLTTLEKAKLRQAARTQEQIDDIKKRAAEREARHKMMREAAQIALKNAKEMPEVSTAALTKAINSGDLDKMYKLAQSVQAKVYRMRAQEQSLADLIPDVHSWHKKYTIKQLSEAHNAIETKLGKWAGFDNQKMKKKLDFEINWIENHPKYATDEVAKAAYKKKLKTVEFNISYEEKEKEIKDLVAFKTKSQDFKNLVTKAQDELSKWTEANKDAQQKKIEAAIQTAKDKKAQLESRRSKSSFSKVRKDKALWDKGDGVNKDTVGTKADAALRPQAEKSWKAASQEQRDMMYEYTHHYADKNEPLEGRHYLGSQTRAEWENKVNLMTEYIDSSPLQQDMWFQRGDEIGALAGRLSFAGGGKIPTDLNQLVGKIIQEGGFMSAGSGWRKGFNEDWGKDVIFNIFAPKGMKAAYAEPFSAYGNGMGHHWDGISKQHNFSQEFETIFQRGTKMRITKVEKNAGNGIIYIDVEIIGQEVKDLSYVADDLIGY